MGGHRGSSHPGPRADSHHHGLPRHRLRSQLEARWAAWFDQQRGIAWEYEPAGFDGWTPDFRLVMDGAETYVEVKPVTAFPMDVAQRILNAGCGGDILILGQGPRHGWRYGGDGWRPVDLTA